MAKKIWKVKCPCCRGIWNYRDDKLFAGPMYKYCRACSKIEAETGRAALRGKIGPRQPRWIPDEE